MDLPWQRGAWPCVLLAWRVQPQGAPGAPGAFGVPEGARGWGWWQLLGAGTGREMLPRRERSLAQPTLGLLCWIINRGE